MADKTQLTLTALLDIVKTNEALKRTMAACLTELQAIRRSLEDEPDEKADASTANALAASSKAADADLGAMGPLEEAIKELAAEELGFDLTSAGGMEKAAVKSLLKSRIQQQRETKPT